MIRLQARPGFLERPDRKIKSTLYDAPYFFCISLSLINILQNGSKKYQGQNHQKTASPILSMVPRGGRARKGQSTMRREEQVHDQGKQNSRA